MTELDEASYYEIALTNRQVLVAFVILLVCMLTSFFAGLWAGRGGIPIASPDPAQILAEQAPPPDDGLEEFTFFSEPEEEGTADLEDLANEPNPETTLVEDLGGKLPPAPKPRIVPEDPPERANPAIPRTTARKPPPPPPSSGKELIVQVFSSADQKQARKVLKQLLDSGYAAFMSPVEVGQLTMYRVRIGPFAERSKAESTAQKIRSRFKLETWITAA